MSTKTRKRKPTQLDRIEQMLLEMKHPVKVMDIDRDEQKEPETFKVGDWVRFIPRSDAPNAPNFASQISKLWDGYKCHVSGWPCEGKDVSFFNVSDLHRLSAEEIAAHLKAEEERNPLKFGTPVRWRDRDGIYLWKEPNDFHRIAVKGDELFSAGTTSSKRSEFVAVNP